MPIRRWHGWAAYCRMCGNVVDLDGGNMVAWEKKEDVKECLDIDRSIEQAITDACGCERRAKVAMKECCRR